MPHSDANEDELEIELRPPRDAALRVVLLSALLHRAYLETGQLSRDDDPTGERFDYAAWATAEGLLDHATESERDALQAHLGALGADTADSLTWQSEALVALGWALGLVPAVPDYLEPANPSALLNLLPRPWDSVAAFAKDAALRPEEAVATERERAELWHWRAEAERAARAADVGERRAIELAVREVATDAAAAGLVPRPVAGDFPAGVRPYRAMNPDQLADAEEIARQRLRALNWLCGFGDDWDNAPLEI